MWGKNQSQKFNAAKIDTLVGRNTVIRGDVSFSGGLHIEGRVEGNVHADDDGSILILIDAPNGSVLRLTPGDVEG